MEARLTSTATDFEAQIIVGRLAEAKIGAVIKGGPVTRGGSLDSPRDVWVEETDLERARQVLEESENVDEDELARLAEQAGREEGAAQD